MQVGLTARYHWLSANLKALMTKRVPKKILRTEQKFFVNLRKKCFWPPTPRRRRFFWTCGAPPPPTEIDRRAAAADTMTSAHSSTRAYQFLIRRVYNCTKRLVIRVQKLKSSFYPAKFLMIFFSHQLQSFNYNCTIHLYHCQRQIQFYNC